MAQDSEQLNDEEQHQAEIELEAERRQEMQAREQQVQQEQVGSVGQVVQAVEQGKQIVKQQIKRKIVHQILLWLASILLNPYTWLIIGLIFVAFLLAWCKDNKVECIKTLGQSFWDAVKLIFGLD